MIGELWWSRLVNSVRFLDDVKDALIDGKSVIMNFSDNIPWLDIMTETLEQKLAFMTASRSFEVHDASKINVPPGRYLFERFCNEAQRNEYWPKRDKSYERFLATNEKTILNHRIICVTGINSGNANAWQKTVNEYLENRNSDEKCIFILVVKGANTNKSKFVCNIRYSDYITDYDCLMLCLTMLSTAKCNSTQKQYISEIASNISHNNVEIAGILATAELALAENPVATAMDVLEENNIIIKNLEERVKTSVWKAQIKLVFPRLEDFRRELIYKYKSKLQKRLPIKSSIGEIVNKVSELEIGQLYFICCQSKLVEKSEFELLKNMREARNLLAHRDILNYSQLSELDIL
ncbi:MAG: hypothetical protein K2L10_09385 [Ruminococcus sp.]|nr:hypothetical protein [Ruminococcus sp.]